MLGYPGAGKTTVSEHIAEATDAVHLNSDQFRLRLFDNPLGISEAQHENMYKLLDYITERILKSGKSVIYDANLNRYVHRQDKYDICERTRAQAKLIWVKTDEEEARKRATVEAGKHPAHRPFGNMKKDVFDRLIGEIEPPVKSEKPVVVDGSDLKKDKVLKAVLINP